MPHSQISPKRSVHFPPTFRQPLPQLLCPVLASGLPFPRARDCVGLPGPNAYPSPTTCPRCCRSIHIRDLADPNCLPGLLLRAPLVAAFQLARHPPRLSPCLPDTHRLITPVAPVMSSTRRSVWSLVWPIPHLASLPGSDGPNPIAKKGQPTCRTEHMGPACGSSHSSHGAPLSPHTSLY